jgi:hypothetical protein
MGGSNTKPLRVTVVIPAGIYTRWEGTTTAPLGHISTTGREVYIPLRSPSTGDRSE